MAIVDSVHGHQIISYTNEEMINMLSLRHRDMVMRKISLFMSLTSDEFVNWLKDGKWRSMRAFFEVTLFFRSLGDKLIWIAIAEKYLIYDNI